MVAPLIREIKFQSEKVQGKIKAAAMASHGNESMQSRCILFKATTEYYGSLLIP